MMITRIFTHFRRSLILGIFVLASASQMSAQGGSINFGCSCLEDDPAGLMSFVINTWGCAPGDIITIQNSVNLLDASGNPLPNGTAFAYNYGTTFTLEGYTDPGGAVPIVSIYKNGSLHFPLYNLYSCRAPQFPMMPLNPEICTGGLVTLSLADVDGIPPAGPITWTAVGSDQETTLGTGSTMDLSYCNPGTYTVTASGAVGYCEFSYTNTVIVKDYAAGVNIEGPCEIYACAGIDIMKDYAATPICPGIEVGYKLLDAADNVIIAPPVTGMTTGSGTGSGTVAFDFSASPIAPGDYTLVLCNLGTDGCKLDGVEKEITVFAGPPTIDLGDPTVDLTHFCAGQPHTITATVPAGATEINWYEVDCTDNTIRTLVQTGGTSLVVNDSGCFEAVIAECHPAGCSASDLVTITYGSGIDLVVDATKKICSADGPYVFPTEMVDGAWSVPITWYALGGTIPLTTGSVSGTYVAFIAQGTSCEQSAECVLTVVDNPPVDLGTHDIMACEGSDVVLYAGDDGAYNYVWSDAMGNIGLPPTMGSLTVTTTGTYCVTATTLDGCCSTNSCVHLEFLVNPWVEIADATHTFCETGCITANVTPMGAGTIPVAWYKDGVLIPGETGNELCDVTISGTYTAVVADGLTCEETAETVVTILDTNPEVNGMSCVCLNSSSEYSLENSNDYTNNWVVCNADGTPAASTSYTLSPSGTSAFVDVAFSVAGDYLIKNSGTLNSDATCAFASSFAVEALVEETGALACNNQVNVTLNNNCELQILPEMILQDEDVNNNAFTIVITDPDGNVITGMLTQDMIGQILTVSVEQKCGGNSCWGTVLVEDKSIEPLSDYCTGGPFTGTCYEVDVPGATIGFPDFPADVVVTYRPATDDWYLVGYDNCSDVILSYVDVNSSADNCSNPQSITRTWTVTDVNNGATSTCTASLLVDLVDISSIVWPKNWDSALDLDAPGAADTDGICPSLELCDTWAVDDFGNPHPSHTGYPSGLVCTNLQVIGYEDQNIPGCGDSRKIVRTWTVWDACAQADATHNQTITVMDTSKPVCSAPNNGSVSTSTHDCGASITVGAPTVVECGSWTYTIRYKLKTANGLSAIWLTDGITYNAADGTYTIVDLPFESEGIVVSYVVTDGCGNVSDGDCTTEVSLNDTEQPIPACDLYNTITLNQFGVAYAGPSTFDDNSWDNCGIYQIVVQRMDTRTSACDCERRSFEFMTYLGEYTNGHHYYISNDATSGSNATAYAAALDGALASGDSTGESDWLATQIAGATGSDVHTSGDLQSGHARYVVEFNETCGFSQIEKFCCEDKGAEVMMMLRVIDLSGNHNFCMTRVTVSDFIRPVITNCPDNMTVDCGTNINLNNLSAAFGDVTATDECSVTIVETTNTDNFTLDQCSQGSLTRTWRVEDCSGNTPATGCTQRITVRDTDPFSASDIRWPRDVDISGGCTLENLDPAIYGMPTWSAGGCSNVVSNYSDLVFYIVEGACQKMIRTWSVVDWCNPDQIYTYDQVFKLDNTESPQINCTSSQLVFTPAGTCSASVTGLTATLNDNAGCTASANWTYEVDLESPFSDTSGAGNDASGTFPIGTHTVTFRVSDACDNTDSCSRTIVVRDEVAPTPYCHAEIVVPISDTLGVEIWASDLDIQDANGNPGSSDACSPNVTLSFSENSVIANRTFDCDDIGDNDVDLWVWDGPSSNSNKASCRVNVIIQDNLGVCAGTGNIDVAEISGLIMTEDEQMIESVGVSVVSPSMAAPTTEMFETGGYLFSNLPMNQDYKIEALKDDNYLNGVSTLDLVMIQRHILDIQALPSPYKIIAADVNNSQSIDGVDLIELRKLILGIYSELPQNNSWRFVDSDYQFADVYNPFPYDEDVDVNSFSTDVADADFVGVKIGDVNSDAVPNFLLSNTVAGRNSNDIEIEIAQSTTEKGNKRVQFVATEDLNLVGTQFSLAFGDRELLAAVPMAMNLTDANVAWNIVDDNVLRISWNEVEGVDVAAGDVLMEFLFEGETELKFAPELSGFDQMYTASADEVDSYSLSFIGQASTAGTFEVMQNIPNPFKDVTVIGFNLPSDSEVNLTITDVDGKLIKSISTDYTAGYNEITIDAEDIDRSGILYYQISAGGFSSSKKMILIK